MREQEPQLADTENHCYLFGVVFVTSMLNASQLLILLFALFFGLIISWGNSSTPLLAGMCPILFAN